MLKKLNLTGLIAGIIIIALAVSVFYVDIQIDTPDYSENMVELETIKKASIAGPTQEADKYYGGDAYTGMQQASAQAANNLIPVFKAIEEGSRIMIAVNDNLIGLNDNITGLNENMAAIAEIEAEHTEQLIAVIQNGIALILIAIGLVVMAKSIEIEIQFGKKKTQIPVEQYYG